MASNITITSTWEPNIVGPDAATDQATAASVRLSAQQVGNRATWLKDAIVTRTWPAFENVAFDASFWAKELTDTVPNVKNISAVAAYSCWIPVLGVLAKGSFSSVAVQLTGSGGHAGLPATMPTMKLWKSSTVRSAKTQIGGTITDTSANAAAYDADHWLTLSGLSEVIAADTSYFLQVTCESGANSLSQGTRLGLVKAVFTP